MCASGLGGRVAALPAPPSPRRGFPSGTLAVVRPRATTPIAPLHDLQPVSSHSSTWLVGRWVRWGADRLNAIDGAAAAAKPKLEKAVADRVGRLTVAIQREFLAQVPPLEVYLADRAFELDELRNASAEARAADAMRKTAEADESKSVARRSKTTETTEESSPPETPASASESARRKMIDFFTKGGHEKAARAATEEGEEARAGEEERAGEESARGPAEMTRGLGELAAREPSASPPGPDVEERTTAPRPSRETTKERQTRWAREGASLAASLAAPSTTPASRSPNAAPRSKKPSAAASRRRASAAAPVAAAPTRLAPAGLVTAKPTRTTLAAPAAETMDRRGSASERPRRRADADENRRPNEQTNARNRPGRRASRRGDAGGGHDSAVPTPASIAEGTPSKRRALRDVSNAVGGGVLGSFGAREPEGGGGKTGVAYAARGPARAMIERLRAAATSAAQAVAELTEASYEGGLEFEGTAVRRKEDKVRVEEVVTVSADGADVTVQTREVAVAGKQI